MLPVGIMYFLCLAKSDSYDYVKSQNGNLKSVDKYEKRFDMENDVNQKHMSKYSMQITYLSSFVLCLNEIIACKSSF